MDHNGKVQRLVCEVGNREAFLEQDGLELWQDGLSEILLNKGGLPFVKLAFVDEVDLLLMQFLHQRGVDRIKFFLQRYHFLLNRLQQVLCTLTLRPFGDTDKPAHFRHANAKKFVEVVGENTQIAHAFNQRDRRILGLLQHTSIKGEPAELSRKEELAIKICPSGCDRVITHRIYSKVACLPQVGAPPYTHLDVIRYRTIAEPHRIRTA